MKTLVATLIVLASLPAAIAAPTVAISTAPRPAPAATLFSWVPTGGYPDPFPYGQCTWWAAYNRRVTWGGDAGDWLANAQSHGIQTDGRPSLGAIVVYRPGARYSQYGHVAIVVALASSSFTVSEMNYLGWGRVDSRTASWPDPAVAGFIPLGAADR